MKISCNKSSYCRKSHRCHLSRTFRRPDDYRGKWN